jgi:hypothetical protein
MLISQNKIATVVAKDQLMGAVVGIKYRHFSRYRPRNRNHNKRNCIQTLVQKGLGRTMDGNQLVKCRSTWATKVIVVESVRVVSDPSILHADKQEKAQTTV